MLFLCQGRGSELKSASPLVNRGCLNEPQWYSLPFPLACSRTQMHLCTFMKLSQIQGKSGTNMHAAVGFDGVSKIFDTCLPSFLHAAVLSVIKPPASGGFNHSDGSNDVRRHTNSLRNRSFSDHIRSSYFH